MKTDAKKRRQLEERLKNYIAPIRPTENEGNILHYCRYGHHYGVIGSIKARRCIKKKCNYYRVYREDLNKIFKRRKYGR